MTKPALLARRSGRSLAPWCAVIALVLASCSSGDAEPEAESIDVNTTAAAVAEDTTTEADGGVDFDWDAECAESAGEDLPAGGGVCADSGLRPETGGFSFENWGGPVEADAVTVEHAVAMFGVEAACARNDADGCVPYPAVTQWIESMNAGMEGGRCEGMAVLSQGINDGYMSVADLQDAAAVTADLQRDAPAVAANISYWWATQSLPSIADFNAATRMMTPVEIARDVARALRDREGVTLGIYFEGGGHAVTPIAVTWDGEGTIEILVYDNNYPGAINRVAIDTASETWSYAGAALNPDQVSDGWSGSTGTMDYTLMGVRQGEQVPPWAAGDGEDDSVRVSVNTAGRSIAGVQVTVGDVVIDSRDLSSATSATGVRIFPSRGRIGTGTTVEIPAGLTDVTVRPIAGEQESPWFTSQRFCDGPCPDDAEGLVDMILDVDMPGSGSLHIEDRVSAVAGEPESFALKFSTAGPFQAKLDVADGADVQAAYALGDQSLDMSLEDGQDFGIVETGDDGVFDLDVYDAEGDVLYELLFDGDLDGETLAGLLFDIDEETGELILGEDLWEAEELDEAFDDLFLGNDEVDEDASADDGAEEDGASDEGGSGDSDDPASDDPATEDPATEDPASDDPASDDPASDDPTTEDPATDDPATDDPATEDPATEDPATDDPPAEDGDADDGG